MHRLATANLRLVAHIITRHYGHCVAPQKLPDLLQAGAEGVTWAAYKFQPGVGVAFSTYASYWILERAQREMARIGHPIRPPGTVWVKLRRLRRVQAELTQQLARNPTAEEISNALSLPIHEVELALERMQSTLSLDAGVAGEEDDKATLGDLLASQGAEEQTAAPEGWELLSKLERRILAADFRLADFSVADVARDAGLSKRAARKIAKGALEKLRDGLGGPK